MSEETRCPNCRESGIVSTEIGQYCTECEFDARGDIETAEAGWRLGSSMDRI